MTELGPILARLGLSQYLDIFQDEGFDKWEIVLDITESDLCVTPVYIPFDMAMMLTVT